MTIGQMRQFIVNRREELKAYAERFVEPDRTNLQNTIQNQFNSIIHEFDCMERQLWETQKQDNRSLFESIFGK